MTYTSDNKLSVDGRRPTARRSLTHWSLTIGLSAILLAPHAANASVLWDTEMVSLNLTGGPFLMPLASDPANLLGDSVDGYGFVDSDVQLTVSSQRVIPGPASLGQHQGFDFGSVLGGSGVQPAFDPADFEGQPFFVDSFFDVFFDITVTDVDGRPGRDYVGELDGASIVLEDIGATPAQSNSTQTFSQSDPIFDLVPPESDPYLTLLAFNVPLGLDVNVNSENDDVAFTLGVLGLQDASRNFTTLPGGVVNLDADIASFLEGMIADTSGGVPFLVGAQLPSGLPDIAAFSGTGSITFDLVNSLQGQAIPEPSTFAISVLGLSSLGMIGRPRRRR